MCKDWIKRELLTERNIEKFNYDYISEREFGKKNRSYIIRISLIVFSLSVLVWLSGNLFDVDIDALPVIEAISVSFMVLWVASVRIGFRRRGVPAICSKCQNIMCRYEYTDEVSGHDLNGVVYLCHDCNTKFIDSRPSMLGC